MLSNAVAIRGILRALVLSMYAGSIRHLIKTSSAFKLVSASTGEKMVYFFAAHARQLYRYRQVRGFDTHFYGVDPSTTGRLDLVIQTLPEGVLQTPKGLNW